MFDATKLKIRASNAFYRGKNYLRSVRVPVLVIGVLSVVTDSITYI